MNSYNDDDAMISFLSFAGLTRGASVTDAIRLYGKPEEETTDTEWIKLKYSGIGLWVTASANSKKVWRITVNRQPGVDFLRSVGVNDDKLCFIGEHLDAIQAAFGKPHSSGHGIYHYQFGANCKVDFVCYDIHNYKCIEISVMWDCATSSPINYYYTDANNQPVGPIADEQLHELFRTGGLTLDSFVIAEGDEEWRTYRAFALHSDSTSLCSPPLEGLTTLAQAELLISKGDALLNQNKYEEAQQVYTAATKLLNDGKNDVPVSAESSQPSVVYMEVNRNLDDYGNAKCSDNSCPCGFPGAELKNGEGYMFVSREVADFRKDCPTTDQAIVKAKGMQSRGEVVSASSLLPILMCELGAKKRGLDLAVAGEDARHWWRTGMVPIRPTPLSR